MSDKKMVAIGDSITHGTYHDGEWFIANPNFATLVKESLGFSQLINYGANGVSISSTSTTNGEYAMSLRIKEMENADMALVAGGTNDYGTSVVLGSAEDKTDVSFFGALYIFFTELKKKYQKVYIVTPIRRRDDGENKVGKTLEDYRKAIEIRAKEFDFCVIDGYGVPIDPKDVKDTKDYIPDGLHPNQEGHKLYAKYIVSRIKEYENGNI